ncbi:conserved Plasmodium protein, unknown function [Plasmodium knowlesi strain H]|uniref:Uncharacterized protein n=3 Tax=Plasmodium knowlesi TaxID=5850 RepID=A0A5K1UX76_PLAKH|nr:conserved Plasmodium protein, unknown function [Plasmodium knowlesi strain H]OTN64761.1 Uncharacterized protein PKNOH_S130168100 [Plasmodium knowlesi]CAA9988849.1 conserved Plasmodium protein, unknown function [Plasmodium knowlesi strain H]SBO24676.1 conserved Plasmodium protein, unknown function [Plasmodium knowlesi strain H]SBO27958.1 conserved Plasmodium protein, unknown function [Plasmodium knowlesi strain H]VVS78323.1 conserved Plasmodium protein, unknown function [Plasmodium knowlesi |eukprot:XP_002261195.1 hypothetical protein, conserved in Plasmodium species [Plasmodium knowlesi strain H]
MKKELKGKKLKGNVNNSAGVNNFKEEKKKIKKKKKIFFNSGKVVLPNAAYGGTLNTGANINANINNLNFGPAQGEEREALQQNIRIGPRTIGGSGPPAHGYVQGGVINNAANKNRKGILQNVNISQRGNDNDGNYFSTNVDGGRNAFHVKNKILNKDGSSALGTNKRLYRGVGNPNEVNTGRLDSQSTFKEGGVVSLGGAGAVAVGDSLMTSGNTFESAVGTNNRKENHVRGNLRVGSNMPQRNYYPFSSSHYIGKSPTKLNLAYTHKIYKNRANIYNKKYFKNNKIVNNNMTGQVKKNVFNPIHNYDASFVNKLGSKSMLDMNDSAKGDHSEDTYFEFSGNGMNTDEGGRDDFGAFFDVGTGTRNAVLDPTSCKAEQGGYSQYDVLAENIVQEISECGRCGRCEKCIGFSLYSSAAMNGMSGKEKREIGEPNISASIVEEVDTNRMEEMDQQMLSEQMRKEKEAFAQCYLEKIIKLLSKKVKRMLIVTDKECIHLVRSIVELLQCVKKIINFSEQYHFHYSIFGIVLNIYANICVKIFAENDILKVANLKCLVCLFEILIMLRRDCFNLSYAFFLFVNYLKSNIDGIDILTKKNLKYNAKVVNNDEKIFFKMVNSFVTLFSLCAECQSIMVRVESLKSFNYVLGMLKCKKVEKGVGSDIGNIDMEKDNLTDQREPSDETPSDVFAPFSRTLIVGCLVGKKGTMFRGHTTGKMINLQKYYLNFFKSNYMYSEVYTQDGGDAGWRDLSNRGSWQEGGTSQPSCVNRNMGSKRGNVNLYKGNMSNIPNQQWAKNNWQEHRNFTNDQIGRNRNIEEREYKTKNSILLINFETIFNSEPSNGWLTNKIDDEDEQHILLFILRIFDLFVDMYQDKEISEMIQKNIVFFLNHTDVDIFRYVTYLIRKISHIVPINKSFFNKYISVLLKNLNRERRKYIFLMLSYSEYEKNGLYVVLNLLKNLCIYNFHYKTNIHLIDFDSISQDSLKRNLGEENDCAGGTGDGVTGRGNGIFDEYNIHPSLNPTNDESFGQAKDYSNVNEHEVYLVDHMIHNNEEWCSVYAVLIVLSFKYPSLIFSFFFNKFRKNFIQNNDNCLPHFNLFDWSQRFGYYISSGVLNSALEGETQVNSRMLKGIISGDRGDVPEVGGGDDDGEEEEDYGVSPTSEGVGGNEGAIFTDKRRVESSETTKISSTTSEVNQVDTHFRAGKKENLPCKEEVALELLTNQMYAFLEYPHCVQPMICNREWSFCYVYISSILNLFFNKNASFFGENCFFFKKNIWRLLHDGSNLKTNHFLEYLEMFKDSNFNYINESRELVEMLNCAINPSDKERKLVQKSEEMSEKLEEAICMGRELMNKWRKMKSSMEMVQCDDHTGDDPDEDLIHFKQPYMKYSRRLSDMMEDHMVRNIFFQIMVKDSYSPIDPPIQQYEKYLRQVSVELIAARLIDKEETGFTHLCYFHRGDTSLSNLFLGNDPFVEKETTDMEVPFSHHSVANKGDISNRNVGKDGPNNLAQHPAGESPVGKDTNIDLSNGIEEERILLDAIIKRNVKMEEQNRKGFVNLESTLQYSIEEGDAQGNKQTQIFRASENSCGEDKIEKEIQSHNLLGHVVKMCGIDTEGEKGVERRIAEGRDILQKRNFTEFKFLKVKIKILHEGGKNNGIPRQENIINFEKEYPEYFYHKKVININHKINKKLIKIYYLFSANYFYTRNISQIIHTIVSKIYEENFLLFNALKDCFCNIPRSGENVWNNFEVKGKNFLHNSVWKVKKGKYFKAVDSMEQFNHVLVGVDELLNGKDKKNASKTYSVNVLINKILKIILKHLKNTNFINYNKCLKFPFLFLSFFDIKINLSFEMDSLAFLEELDQGNFKNILLNLPYHVRHFFGNLFLYIEYEDIFLVDTEKCQVREIPPLPRSSQCQSRRHRNNLTTYNFMVENIIAEDYSLKYLKNMNKTKKKETKNSLFAKRKKAKAEIQNVKNTSDYELEEKYLKVHNANVGNEEEEKIKKRSSPFKKINKLNYYKIDVSEWNIRNFRCAGDKLAGYRTPCRRTIIVEFKKTVQMNFDCSSTLPVKCKINFCYYHLVDGAFRFFPLTRTKHIYVHPSQ